MKKRTLPSLAAALLLSLSAGAFGFETVEEAQKRHKPIRQPVFPT